jgi:hypothetical protein
MCVTNKSSLCDCNMMHVGDMMNVYNRNSVDKVSIRDKSGIATLVSSRDTISKKSISKAQKNYSKNSKCHRMYQN